MSARTRADLRISNGRLVVENGELRKRVGVLEAELARARSLPNGWQQPTFLTVDDGGGLNLEWCFGTGEASFTLAFVWEPDEGVMAVRTRNREQDADETEAAAKTLAYWLTEAAEARGVLPADGKEKA
jgi:hypothetical protein